MTADLVYHSSKYAMAEMLLSGITTFMDMYYFEDEVAKAADEMKMRGFVGETIVDFLAAIVKKLMGDWIIVDGLYLDGKIIR